MGFFQFKVGRFKMKARTNLGPQNYMYLSAPGHQYTGILKFVLYGITYLRNKYSKIVFSTSLGVGMQIRNLYRISCTHKKSQPTKSFVWQNIDACVNDCNVPAIDLLLAEACDFGALHCMLPALMVGCEPLRRRVDIDGKHLLQLDISIWHLQR